MALVALALAPTAAAELLWVDEGTIHSFAAANSYAWEPPERQYRIIVVAGNSGAEVDFSQMQTATDLGEERLRPGMISTSLIEVEREDIIQLSVLNGSGAMVLARIDLERGLRLGRPAPHLQVDGHLRHGECRAFFYDTAFMAEPALLRAGGQGALVAAYEADLQERVPANERLEIRLDPNRDSGVISQACHSGMNDAPAAFNLEAIYPAPAGSVDGSETKRNTPFVANWVVAILIVTLALRPRARGHKNVTWS